MRFGKYAVEKSASGSIITHKKQALYRVKLIAKLSRIKVEIDNRKRNVLS